MSPDSIILHVVQVPVLFEHVSVLSEHVTGNNVSVPPSLPPFSFRVQLSLEHLKVLGKPMPLRYVYIKRLWNEGMSTGMYDGMSVWEMTASMKVLFFNVLCSWPGEG